jgi:hypothetical protein
MFQRRTVTVTTDVNHGIHAGHKLSILMLIHHLRQLCCKVQYTHRRVLVGIETFSAVGVNSSTNTINIVNHGYESGDKVIHHFNCPVKD